MISRLAPLDRHLITSALMLLLFICLTHLMVLFIFISSSTLLPFCSPVALILSLVVPMLLRNQLGLLPKEVLVAFAISILAILFSIIVSTFYFDFSWDGQWYHQAAIYYIEDGWNPFSNPIREFDKNNDLSILHFPKGSWYYGAAVLSIFKSVETGKSVNWIVLFATFFFSYSTLKSLDYSTKYSVLFSALVVMNPVVWSEITTYLVDGLLFLYLTIYILAMLTCICKPNYFSLLVAAMAIICLVNTKFTGLVFLCVFVFFIAIYIIVKKKNLILKFFVSHFSIAIIAILIFGFNPYVTNFIERGHPFYPIAGTDAYPSIFKQTGNDDNELYETPQNVVGKSFFTRFVYTTFGRPGNAPYNNEKEAKLIAPFTFNIRDWKAYHYHETRVAGFGPFFSGILILSIVAILIIFVRRKTSRGVLLLCVLSIFTSLLISKHFWWPRLAPQTWLFVVLPVVFLLYEQASPRVRRLAEALSLLIAINSLIVLIIHLRWETSSSISLRKEISALELSEKPIEIDYGWFKKSMEEKLNRRGIKYSSITADRTREADYKTLTSVVEGYPNLVLYRQK